MKNLESCMDWMSFSDKMKQSACELSRSACPMVLVLPDGREIRFTDINVDTFDYKGKRGDAEYTSKGFKVNLLGAEVTDCKGDDSSANSPYGNGAKMREALSKFCAYSAVVLNNGMFNRVHLEALLNMAKAALAAPPRNCDRFGSEPEMRDAFIAYYNEVYDLKGSKYEIDTCDLKHDVDGILHEYIKWLFSPEKSETKGATDGSK